MKKLLLFLFALALALPGFAQLVPLTKGVSESGVIVQKPLYVLRRVSDKFVINPRAISNTTGLPNPGPDQEYLPILTEPTPDNDPVFTIRTQVEAVNELLKQDEIKYVITDRPKEEVKVLAENAERLEAAKYVSQKDFPRDMTLLAAALLRAQRGLELTPQEQAAADKTVANAAILTENLANLQEKKALIDAGQKIDLSAGYVKEVAPVSP